MIIKIHNHCQFEPSNSLSFQGFCKWCGKEQSEHSTTMSNNKQSSIEWLIRELDLDNASPTMKAINHARAMHKEEIENAVKQGWDYNEEGLVQWMGETYYNETFNTKDK